MPQILTWALFLAQLKREAALENNEEDTMMLGIANELLVEICANTENLRDVRIDVTTPIATAGFLDLPNYYLHEVEQVYYQMWGGGSLLRQWAITEEAGMVCPAPVEGKPNSYVMTYIPDLVTFNPSYRFTFNPLGSGTVADKVRVIASGIPTIVGVDTVMPYVSFYPMLQRSILQRLQMKRNKDPEKTKQWEPLITRAAQAAGLGSRDDGNDLTKEKS
jgi:hypothetical protein